MKTSINPNEIPEMTVLLTTEQLETIIERATTKALVKHDSSRIKADPPDKVYNYNQVAKMIGKAYTTVKRMVKEGRIVPVADGTGITRKEIDRYLNALKS